MIKSLRLGKHPKIIQPNRYQRVSLTERGQGSWISWHGHPRDLKRKEGRRGGREWGKQAGRMDEEGKKQKREKR